MHKSLFQNYLANCILFVLIFRASTKSILSYTEFLQNLPFSSNFDLQMTSNWRWNTLYGWFWCQFVQNFNSNILELNLISFPSIWEKYCIKRFPYPLFFRGVWKIWFFFFKKKSREYGTLNMNLLWSVHPLITSSYSFWLQIPQFQVWIFYRLFLLKIEHFWQKSVCTLWGKFWSI